VGTIEQETPVNKTFVHSNEPEPHHARTKAIIRQHPEIRGFIGKNPYSVLIIVTAVAMQLTLAVLLAQSPWWLILIVAYCVGAIIDHALFVLIHEAAHNLMFRKPALNTLAGILANLPSVIPSSVSFKRYHLKHHSFQGVYDLDADIPSEWEARLIGNSPVGKALWLLFFPLFQLTRPMRIKQVKMIDGWILLNMAVVFAVDAVILLTLGLPALLYLLISLFFSVGLHPVGARWIQRHYLVDESQETYSYYGKMNTLALNVGYHNEHHDFPSIPWNALPRVKQTAPEYYEELKSHTSWGRLLIQFIVDPKLSLFSRTIREERGGRRLDDPVTPDLDALAARAAATRQTADTPS
jgi:sphingolipid delta-4 desaturase